MVEKRNIIVLESLFIGFRSGRKDRILLPALSAVASAGEMVSIIGRNGIGKSTLLRTLAGIQKPLGGNIFFDGRNTVDLKSSDLARIAGFISTEQVKVSNMTVYDLVSLGRFPYTDWLGNQEPDDISIINDAMAKASILSLSDKFVSELSDGERQKSMIARLLAQDAGILLMDEPTAFLDIRSKFELMHLMHELSHKDGKTIIYTTHDLDLALRHSDKIWLILDDGLAEGAPEDLMLTGKFDHLFDSRVVRFSSSDGTYSFNEDIRGKVFIEGEGKMLYWTKKAVERAGFTVTEKVAGIHIILSGGKWLCSFPGYDREYSSLYQMIRDLYELT